MKDSFRPLTGFMVPNLYKKSVDKYIIACYVSVPLRGLWFLIEEWNEYYMDAVESFRPLTGFMVPNQTRKSIVRNGGT